jgi:hypothetical protein
MAEIATKSGSVVKTPLTRRLGIPALGSPAAGLASVVDRTSELSNEVLKSLEEGERAAIQALGQFVITIEEALPQEVAGTSDVAKKITVSGLEVADRLVETEYDVLRKVIDSAAKSLSRSDGAKPKAA